MKEVILMGYEQMMQKMTFLMYGDQLSRVNVAFEEDGTPVIQVDLHEFSCRQAQKTLMNIIAMYRFGFKLEIIHGYNHGTAIKDMIRKDFTNKRIIGKYYPRNPGRTILEIA